MKDAVKREQLGSDIDGDFRFYKNDEQSVEDYILWLDYNNFPTTVLDAKDFVDRLKSKGYFEEHSIAYLNGLNAYLT